MTPDQLRTARALLGWSRRQLSARSGISLNVVKVLSRLPWPVARMVM